MARKRRQIQAGYCYHVMLRGNGGQDIFKDDADRTRFCLLLQYASEKHKLNIHGFCLMGNHVHIVIQPLTSNLSTGMHALAFRYAQHFNRKYKRRGYLYQDRYKAVLVQSGSYLRRLVRYVHLNPVRARIVKRPGDYHWSSYRAYIGEDDFTWFIRNLILDTFSDESNNGVKNLLEYTQMNDDEAREEATEIRKSFRRGAYGDKEFLDKWRPILGEDEVRKEIHLRGADEITLESIAKIVCCRLGTTLEEVRSDKRSKQLVQARTVMACLTRRLCAGSISSLGRYISRDPTTLAKLARKGELDSQIQVFTEELLKVLILGGNQ